MQWLVNNSKIVIFPFNESVSRDIDVENYLFKCILHYCSERYKRREWVRESDAYMWCERQNQN